MRTAVWRKPLPGQSREVTIGETKVCCRVWRGRRIRQPCIRSGCARRVCRFRAIPCCGSVCRRPAACAGNGRTSARTSCMWRRRGRSGPRRSPWLGRSGFRSLRVSIPISPRTRGTTVSDRSAGWCWPGCGGCTTGRSGPSPRRPGCAPNSRRAASRTSPCCRAVWTPGSFTRRAARSRSGRNGARRWTTRS